MTEGAHVVGQDLQPGRYVSQSVDCSWARQGRAANGSLEVIAAGTSSGQTVVDVLATDAGFTSTKCGTWSPFKARSNPLTTFGDGVWIVGGEISPGTYRPAAGDGCTWSRLRDFQGVGTSFIAMGSADNTATVVLPSSDAGFSSSGCGTWNLSR